MSWRVSLIKDSDNTVYDSCISDFESLLDLVNDCAWNQPMRVIYDDVKVLIEFLYILDTEKSFSPNYIWTIDYLAPDGKFTDVLPEHPSWDDIERLAKGVMYNSLEMT